MNFERGKDPMTAIGLGKFGEVEEALQKFFFVINEIWKSDFKFVPDTGGGNQHKFLIWINANDTEPVKEAYKFHMMGLDKHIGPKFESKSINFYRNNRMKKKYGFHDGDPGMLAEIIVCEIFKISRKAAKRSHQKAVWQSTGTWTNGV